jgi:regulator of replication initiation timing
MFNSNYSTSNPFSFNNKTTNSIEESLMQTYAQLEALKAKQNQLSNSNVNQAQQSTVFTDIANEFKELSDDEHNFIVNSAEYQNLNNKYQSEFSQFLINKFSNEYLQTTGNTRTLEEMLFTIKSKKDQYKQKFAKDINEIRDQNKELLERNNALAANNIELQNQLKKLLKDK